MTEPPTSMRAAVLDAPGPPEARQIREVPVPAPEAGQVLIKVEAFGLNRSELATRLGLADGVIFPRPRRATGPVDPDPGWYLLGRLELVGTPTLPDTLRATRVHGVVCFTGMLSNQWTVRDFYPIEYIPRGVRLTAYGGDAGDLPPAVLQEFLDESRPVEPECRSTAPTNSTTSPKPTPTWRPAAQPASSS